VGNDGTKERERQGKEKAREGDRDKGSEDFVVFENSTTPSFRGKCAP